MEHCHDSTCDRLGYSLTSCLCGFTQKHLARMAAGLPPPPEPAEHRHPWGRGVYTAKRGEFVPITLNSLEKFLSELSARAKAMPPFSEE